MPHCDNNPTKLPLRDRNETKKWHCVTNTNICFLLVEMKLPPCDIYVAKINTGFSLVEMDLPQYGKYLPRCGKMSQSDKSVAKTNTGFSLVEINDTLWQINAKSLIVTL